VTPRDFRTVAWTAAHDAPVESHGAPVHNFDRRYRF